MLSRLTTSPVRYQPSSSKAASVASGSSQYPEVTLGPRTRSCPSSSVRVSTPGTGRPTVPGTRSVKVLAATMGAHSVAP